jgi:hypothetical protein
LLGDEGTAAGDVVGGDSSGGSLVGPDRDGGPPGSQRGEDTAKREDRL